jgi:Tfp pilus assembly protein PilO
MNPRYSRYYTYVRPILKNKVIRTYSSLIFSLIAVIIFTLYALKPTVQTIISLNKSIAEQTSTAAKIKNKINNLTQGRSNYENLSPNLKEKLTELVPNNPSLPSLINQLNISATLSDASVSGIQFESIVLESSTKPLNKKPEIKEINFTMTAEGDYAKLIAFLEELNKMNRLVTISSVTFNKPQDSALFLSINAKAYYLKD